MPQHITVNHGRSEDDLSQLFDMVEAGDGRWKLFDKRSKQQVGDRSFRNGSDAMQWLRENGYDSQAVHTLPITPAMKQSVMEEGQPLYVGAPPVPLAPPKQKEPALPTKANALDSVPLRSLMRRVTNTQPVPQP